MGVSRAGYYKWLKHKPTIRDHRREEIVEKVKEVHEKHRTHGYRWTAAFIRINMHLEISDNYSYKCFSYLGIKAETRHRIHSRPRKVKDKYPNLIYSTWETVDRPRQVIVSDMTMFHNRYTDFEEFLWANGMNQDVIEALRKFYTEETPVPEGIHVAMKQYLNLYVAIGGLPAPINAFLATNNMNAVSEEYKGILKEYRDDRVKYAPDKDKPHIRECFNSIPKQLAKENKKFQYSKVKPGGRGETYLGSLQWLEDAGIICRCYNTDITGLPIEGNAKDNVFKVYTADIGLLIEMLGSGTRADILQGNLGGFKGAIFENLMADTLHKKQQSLYYFLKDSGLELDFLVRMKGECVPLEVKAKTAQAKSVQTVLKHADKYHVKHIVKFGDYNVGRKGQLLTLPNYMQFLLDLEPEEIVLEPIDVDAVNALAKKILG